MTEINWPDCYSCIAILKTTSFFLFTSREYKVFTISGGQLQYSSHPNLDHFNIDSPPIEEASMSCGWRLGSEGVALLDDYTYDPRHTGCTNHANMNGGLYKANVEIEKK